VYQGAFRVPAPASSTATFDYAARGLAYNPANNSLFLTGHDWYQKTAEISIPALVNSTNVISLNTATLLQPFADATEGRLGSINPLGGTNKIGGYLVYNGRLIVTGFTYYDGTGAQTKSHFARPLSLSTTGQVQGPYTTGSRYPGFVSGYMTQIPSEWQSSFGGPALTGNCCLSITSVQSNGPAASVFDPDKIGQGSAVAATPVVGYPYPNVLGSGEATQNPYFNLSTSITGIVFPAGSRSVLFIGRHGVGPYCYGPGTADQSLAGKPADAVDPWCYDPSSASKGTHAYPYKYQVWAYDANDLVAVKQGSKQQDAVKPYTVWNFSLPFERAADAHNVTGAAYDSKNNLIYVSQACADYECSPIIHVFKVQGSVAAPNPPTNVTVN
jgi:hypothetical protein